ncbi:hypothetical protein EDB87DRAFT_1610498 [Lactarius vividus]|nr:hypothetical protein EDB87DRAFT_1610498 [Lactarius vividus]
MSVTCHSILGLATLSGCSRNLFSARLPVALPLFSPTCLCVFLEVWTLVNVNKGVNKVSACAGDLCTKNNDTQLLHTLRQKPRYYCMKLKGSYTRNYTVLNFML